MVVLRVAIDSELWKRLEISGSKTSEDNCFATETTSVLKELARRGPQIVFHLTRKIYTRKRLLLSS